MEARIELDLALLFLAGAEGAPLDEVQIYLDAAETPTKRALELLGDEETAA